MIYRKTGYTSWWVFLTVAIIAGCLRAVPAETEEIVLAANKDAPPAQEATENPSPPPTPVPVKASIAKITVSPKAYSLNVCEEKKLGISVKDANKKRVKNAQVTWKSTNPKVATVNEEGIAVGRSPGFTFIRAIHGEVKSNPVSLFVRDKGTSPSC